MSSNPPRRNYTGEEKMAILRGHARGDAQFRQLLMVEWPASRERGLQVLD